MFKLSAAFVSKVTMEIEMKEKMNKHLTLVLFEFNLVNGTKLGFCFNMNSPVLTLYPHEQEVILHSGYFFNIDSVKTSKEDGFILKISLSSRSHL